MRIRIFSFLLVFAVAVGLFTLASLAASPADAVATQQLDTEVPPGNPVIGSDRPGDIDSGGDTNYALWSLVAVCLIGAGALLVTIERWEARRIGQAERAPTL